MADSDSQPLLPVYLETVKSTKPTSPPLVKDVPYVDILANVARDARFDTFRVPPSYDIANEALRIAQKKIKQYDNAFENGNGILMHHSCHWIASLVSVGLLFLLGWSAAFYFDAPMEFLIGVGCALLLAFLVTTVVSVIIVQRTRRQRKELIENGLRINNDHHYAHLKPIEAFWRNPDEYADATLARFAYDHPIISAAPCSAMARRAAWAEYDEWQPSDIDTIKALSRRLTTIGGGDDTNNVLTTFVTIMVDGFYAQPNPTCTVMDHVGMGIIVLARRIDNICNAEERAYHVKDNAALIDRYIALSLYYP